MDSAQVLGFCGHGYSKGVPGQLGGGQAYLHDATVLFLGFYHLHGVVAEVVMEGDMADAICLYGAQQYCLFEVTVIPQYLATKFRQWPLMNLHSPLHGCPHPPFDRL